MKNVQLPFLITGHPRSGTHYMAKVLQKLGYWVRHEDDRSGGTVSWFHAAWPVRYKIIAYQLRNPLKVINSPISYNCFERAYRVVRGPSNGSVDYLYNRMHFWVEWDKHINRYIDFWYRIESFKKDYSKILKRLGLNIPSKLPNIGTDYRTKKHQDNPTIYEPAYQEYTWADLFNKDKKLAKKLKKRAEYYGYKI